MARKIVCEYLAEVEALGTCFWMIIVFKMRWARGKHFRLADNRLMRTIFPPLAILMRVVVFAFGWL